MENASDNTARLARTKISTILETFETIQNLNDKVSISSSIIKQLQKMKISSFPLIGLLAIGLFVEHGNVDGHSFLLDPKGDFVSFNKPECRIGGPLHSPHDFCPGPCISKTSWQIERNPGTTTYERGQLVTMSWARNNHKGGFVRFSIVPRHLRMSHRAHNRLAFQYSCFEAGAKPCSYAQCGTDEKKVILSAQVRIPSIYPDGLYVLGWSWFGGTVYNYSYFGDYWSCANLEIRGGALQTESFPIVFHPGNKTRGSSTVGSNSCEASTDNVGICKKEPCKGRSAEFMVPAPFSKPHRPSPISAYWLNSTSASPVPIATITALPSLSPSATVSPTASVETSLTPLQEVSVTPELSLPSESPSFSQPISPSPNKIAEVLVSEVRLIDIETNRTIESDFYKTVTIPRSVKRMTFVAETQGSTSFVDFYLDYKFVGQELYEPYSCFGDAQGIYNPWSNPIFDRWVNVNVSATSPDNFVNYKVFWFQLTRSEN